MQSAFMTRAVAYRSDGRRWKDFESKDRHRRGYSAGPARAVRSKSSRGPPSLRERNGESL